MNVQRTLTVIFPDDADLRATLHAVNTVKQTLSPVCYNNGTPLGALPLQRAAYQTVKGTVSSQLTISAIRVVAAAYASAKRNRKAATRPFSFVRPSALFLIGQRGRDADFRADGTLSIWTVAGRKRITYAVPAYFKPLFAAAVEFDSMTVIERNGGLLGRVTVTLALPDPKGVHPIGVDRGETNILVAVDADDNETFVSGLAYKVANRKQHKVRSRLQRKYASRKAEGQDTRSIRRLFKRLGRRQRNRTRTFVQTAAKQLVTSVAADSVIVLEDLRIPQVAKRMRWKQGTRRRMSQWARSLLERCITNKAEQFGIAVAYVNPAYTSQTCSRCGLRGHRLKHRFSCVCGYTDHADLNAARNIRDRFTGLRSSGDSVNVPRSPAFTGKPPASAGGN